MNSYSLKQINRGLSHSFSVIITIEMMSQFEAISGDINPLHTNESFARQKGYENKVVYGMLVASFYSTLVGVYLPGRHALLQGVDVHFQHPVFPGDLLSIYGEVINISEAVNQIEIKAYICNQSGVKVSKARIKVGVNEQ